MKLEAKILGQAFICLFLFATPGWATEKNPPGDIPDDQVFVSYTSSLGGYSPKVGLVPKKVPTSTSSTSLTEWLWPQLQRLRR
jgi:hypothetical protein